MTSEHGGGEGVVLLEDSERGYWARYMPGFLPGEEALSLYESLRAGTPFESERVVVYGNTYEVKRKSFAYGEEGLVYRYAGLERIAAPFTLELDAIRRRIERSSESKYNFVLCNMYPDGSAGLGWHADDEAGLVRGATIASISLGAERDFDIRIGKSGSRCTRVRLAHGSLLLMGGTMQQHCQHSVPKSSACTEPRINLTFRLMRADSR